MSNGVKNKIAQHLELIKENSVDLISESELVLKLENSFKKNKPLKLKIGFDPTARDIHLGHTVLLRKLRKLQDLGHQVHLIIGDFTAKIGDPSQRSALRPVLSDREIKSNAATYTKQVFKILNKKKTKIINNSIWYKKMGLPKFLSLLSSYTIARILERDDFSQRIKKGKPLTVLEIIYPLIQGYDSYKMEADIEFGGTDQKFNLIVGRHLQQTFGQSPQVVVTMPILVGLDGKDKMSKSLNNYIGVTEDSKSMFGKIMSISDEIMWEYIRLLSDFNPNELKEKHPKEVKLNLSESIVSFYHSKEKAQKERKEFEGVFSKGQLPKEMPIVKVKESVVDIIEILHNAKMVASKNEARRLLSQGSISLLDSEAKVIAVLKEQSLKISSQGAIFKVGKKRFLKLILQ
ncbi:MAG: tyrosine--tRNA ligase [Candidatus Omnitrophica bacterium]|nr:tyrosine--tRNA ligase [Candidatus Omnitrophota bacterium]